MSTVNLHSEKNTNSKKDIVNEHPFELRHEVKSLNTRLEEINEAMKSAEFKDMLENYSSTKKRLISNFTAGIARGLGMSLGTVVVLALLGWLLSFIVDMNLPGIGRYIAELQGYIDQAK